MIIESSYNTELIARLRLAPRIPFRLTYTAIGAGANIFPVPAAGQQAVIVRLLVQSGLGAAAVNVNIQESITTTIIMPVPCPAPGQGLSFVFPEGGEIRLAAANAIFPNLSVASSVNIFGAYYLVNSTTREPI